MRQTVTTMTESGILLLSVIITCYFVGMDGQTINDTKRLHEELFVTKAPNEDIIPVENQSILVQVSFYYISFDFCRGIMF